MKNLKEKITEFFDFIDNQENQDVVKVEEKFKKIFENEYILRRDSINEAYYQIDIKHYYIKDSNGISLSIVAGDGDRYGERKSHIGMDMYIKSQLSKSDDVSKGIYIFYENEYSKEKIANRINDFFDIDLSFENLIKNDDNNVYDTITVNIKNDPEIVNNRYKQLEYEAEQQNSEERDYSYISPYGGEDVEIHPISEILYKKINEHKKDQYFFNRAIAMFNQEYPEYLKDKIERQEYALYIIENKEQYKKILETESQLMFHYDITPKKDLEDIKKEREVLYEKLNNLRSELGLLKNRKYNFLEILSGKKKKDLERISEIIDPENNEGLIYECKEEIEMNEQDEKIYTENIKYEQELIKEKQSLEEKVNKPFKNFTIDEDCMEKFENGEYCYLKSLRLLVDEKEEREKSLKIYKENLKIAEENKFKLQREYRMKLNSLKQGFKKITLNDKELAKYFSNDVSANKYQDIITATAIVGGIDLRNLQRENKNLTGEKEEYPYNDEQLKMIDQYNKIEKICEANENELEMES